MLLSAGAAWGSEDGFVPPVLENKIDVVAVLVAIAAALVMVGVSFKNANRTHLD